MDGEAAAAVVAAVGADPEVAFPPPPPPPAPLPEDGFQSESPLANSLVISSWWS